MRMGFEDMDDNQKLGPISGVMQLPLHETLLEAATGTCAKKDIDTCVAKGKTMHTKKAGKPVHDMTPELYGAILLYTSNAIYQALNKALRNEDRAAVKKYYPYLRMLFESCARFETSPKTLWRGIG